MKRNSKTHHEELATSTPCAEESDAVVEGGMLRPTALKRKSFKRAVVSGFEAKIHLPDSVGVLMCWFEVKKT